MNPPPISQNDHDDYDQNLVSVAPRIAKNVLLGTTWQHGWRGEAGVVDDDDDNQWSNTCKPHHHRSNLTILEDLVYPDMSRRPDEALFVSPAIISSVARSLSQFEIAASHQCRAIKVRWCCCSETSLIHLADIFPIFPSHQRIMAFQSPHSKPGYSPDVTTNMGYHSRTSIREWTEVRYLYLYWTGTGLDWTGLDWTGTVRSGCT
jgi:hypothetical protein